MKKLFGILAASALAVSAFAQGTVVFNNNASSLVKQWTSSSDNTLMSVAKGNGSVELFAALPSTPYNKLLGTLGANGAPLNYPTLAAFLAANTGWSDIGITKILPVVAGQFNGGTLPLTGITAGNSASYVIVGWNGTAATLNAAIAGNAFIGESSPLTTGTGGTGTPPSTGVALSDTFTGMTLAPFIVPEPSTFALAGLGAAAMLILRRRK